MPLLVARTSVPQDFRQHPDGPGRVHAMARAYAEANSGEYGDLDLDLAATICMHVVLHFAPLIALSPAGSDERERFIAEIIRMLTSWVEASW